MWSFRHNDKSLSGAYVKEVTAVGVKLVGKDERGNLSSMTVPLEEASKSPALQLKAKKEIAEAIAKPGRELRKEIDEIKRNQRLYAKIQAFDAYTKVPQGWIVYILELEEGLKAWSPSKMRKDSWDSGAMQSALLVGYGKPVAEGDRIIAAVEERGIREVDVFGNPRTLRVFEVIGDEKKEDAEDSAPGKTAISGMSHFPTPTVAQPASSDNASISNVAPSANTVPAQPHSELTIVSATYGADDVRKDVTQLVAAKVSDDRLNFRADNSELCGDPVFGKVKELRVRFVSNGQETERTFREGEQVSLP